MGGGDTTPGMIVFLYNYIFKKGVKLINLDF